MFPHPFDRCGLLAACEAICRMARDNGKRRTDDTLDQIFNVP
jgi:hypothetical protein